MSAQRIAHRHGHIALPALVTDAANRAAFGVGQKFGFGPAEQHHQVLPGQTGALIKIRQRAALGIFVPGANQLAIVTAINAVADEGAQIQRNAAVVFDRQVRNATARVDQAGRQNGLGGANIDTSRAAAAMVAGRFGGCQRKVHINFTQEKHRTGLAVEYQAVFAAPTLSAAGGQFGFQYRGGIGEDAVAKRANLGGNVVTQFLQAAAQHLVVIAPPGVERDDACLRAGELVQLEGLPTVGRGRRQVVHAHGDHAHSTWHQLGRSGAFESVRRQVGHVAIETTGQPIEQRRFGRR